MAANRMRKQRQKNASIKDKDLGDINWKDYIDPSAAAMLRNNDLSNDEEFKIFPFEKVIENVRNKGMIKDLCDEEKGKIRQLIKQLMKCTEENEKIIEENKEEKKCYNENIIALRKDIEKLTKEKAEMEERLTRMSNMLGSYQNQVENLQLCIDGHIKRKSEFEGKLRETKEDLCKVKRLFKKEKDGYETVISNLEKEIRHIKEVHMEEEKKRREREEDKAKIDAERIAEHKVLVERLLEIAQRNSNNACGVQATYRPSSEEENRSSVNRLPERYEQPDRRMKTRYPLIEDISMSKTRQDFRNNSAASMTFKKNMNESPMQRKNNRTTNEVVQHPHAVGRIFDFYDTSLADIVDEIDNLPLNKDEEMLHIDSGESPSNSTESACFTYSQYQTMNGSLDDIMRYKVDASYY